ncbi:molybdenum ABC transporter ATP-binding protein ModC [Vibrio algivorus]|uniref:Molybdenum import ATP-binding protein ModC n=1 Tax=Vibrio algivorus TaxID=1667024 RepID=A0ABQ6EM60_9VIBR|nr:molybdenum ABC transporter ATP-binding protein ModC [Vibrio algivorus]GLT14084.1 molybdenum import ATP-binding protein ModC [Vibrio algivorus]
MIDLNFKQRFPDFELDIQAQVPSSGITAIFGRSGAGKTSIINAISGLKNPDSGSISINQRVLFDSQQAINLAIEKRDIGYVFQESRLFPHYKVKGNLLYGVKNQAYLGKSELPRNFNQVVDLLGLSELLDRYPADLSGGEKQRCAIARALLSEPKVLLMDEPLASLDLPRKKEVMPFLESLAQEIQIPILYVTHSLDEILHLADHMLLMDSGRVVDSGDIERMWASSAFKPWHDEADLSTIFKGVIKQHHQRYALTYVEIAPSCGVWMSGIDANVDESVRIRIHASDVSLTLSKSTDTSIRNILPAQVIELAPVTDPALPVSICLAIGESEVEHYLWANITAWAYEDLQLEIGQKVYAQIKGVKMTNKDMAIRK